MHFTAFSVDVAKWRVIVSPEMETTARSCLFCGAPVPRWGTNSGHLLIGHRKTVVLLHKTANCMEFEDLLGIIMWLDLNKF